MLYLLDKEVKTVKWNGIPLHEASSAIVKEEINGDFTLTVRYPITDTGIYQLIKEDMLIKAPSPVLGPQLFRIKKPVENDDSLDITAYHITDDIMQRSIPAMSAVGVGCATALSLMVQQAKSDLAPFTFTSNISTNRTFNTKEAMTLYSVLMDGKHSMVGTWEGELVRDNFVLSIKNSRGSDRGVVITTHKNLKSYQRTRNSQSVVTRIYAKSTFKAEGAEEETTINVTVDSPLIGNYPYINEKDYENNNAKTVDELRKWAEAKFKNEGIDKISDAIEIEAYELDGQVIHLGDTVNIKSRKHSVDIYKKAIAYEYNALTEEYISITFDDKPGVGGSGVSSGVSNAADVILSANKTAQEIAIERVVKNANQAFDAEFDKRVEEINDGIEQSRAEAERYADQIKTEISQEFDTFEHEYQATKQSQSQQIADILAKAQANTILATDAKNIGNQAKADAANALSKAIQYKNEAIAEATRLDTVERQATETKLATAKSQAISEATRMVETAKSLLSGQISNISTDLSQTKEAIKLLATKATVDTLTGRVSSAEAMIQVQADQISQRVKTSDFDQAKQRISTAESSITQLGNRITTEISETVAKIPTELGIRNLIKGTKDLSGNNPNQNTSDTYLGFNIARSRPSSGYIDTFRAATTINATATSYVTTFYARSDVDGFLIDCHLFSPNTTTSAESSTGHKTKAVDGLVNVRLTTEWTRYWVKWTQTPVNEIKNFIVGRNRVDRGNATVEIAGVALYEGDIPKDWSPAPEDAVAEIENVKTTITQTAEGQVQLSNKLTETAGKVTAAETSIRQLVNDVSSKVSQTIFDNLKRTVESQGTTISQNQSAIALKADKTVTDQLSKSIEKTNAELKVTSDAVNTKVSSVDFNVVSGRLTTAETTIKTMAGTIETKLSRTDTEGIVTNAITQSENGTNQRISQVEGKIPTNLGGTNLVRGSAELKRGSGAWSQGHWRGSGSGGKVEYNVTLPSSPIKGIATGAKITSDNSNQIGLCQDGTSLEAGTYTLSVWVLGASGLKVHVSSAYSQDTNNPYTAGNKFVTLQDNSWTLITQTFTLTKRYNNISLAYLMFDSPGTVYFAAPYIHASELPGDWSPAPEDIVTVSKFNEVSDTVDAHKRTISEQGNSISQVIQTAQGLVTRISNLSSGNRNMLKGTKDLSGMFNQAYKTSDNYQGFTIARTSSGSAAYYDTFRTSTTIVPTSDTYIISFYGRASVEGTRIANHFFSPNTTLTSETSDGYKSTSTDGTAYVTLSTSWKRYWIIWTQRETTTIKNVIVGRNHSTNNATVEIAGVALYEGNLNKDWSPAPEDGDTAFQAVSTQVSTLAGSWSVQNLNSSGDILSQANLSSAQFLLEAAKIRLKGKTLADEIQAIDGKFGTLFVADGTFAKLNANVIDSQAITADKLKVDQAFFTKFMANDAYLKQLFTKSAFITQVQAVTMSASQISGGILTATNGAMQVNLNAGQIMYYTDQAALKRVLTGYPTQFVKFATGTVSGKGNAGVTVIGSNRWNSESSNDGGFVGIRAWNGANIDSLDLVGDEIRLASSAFDNPDGWDVKTLDSGLRIAPHNRAAERNSRIEVGDVWIMKGNGTYSSLRDILNAFNGNFSKGPNADSYTYYPNGF
ncbi:MULTISPECIES: phage tail spike protein [Streptococcus]|uniref:phage tail spike protein n=1 Tax=Streptococcus TaxID=1301 RepID=UPI001C8D8EBD|nr:MULTISPECIES: phage tail spike protein [Streptococcus]MBY0719626.1 carbohydrate binding domain-containing protein [Streptococcus sp. 2018110]MCO8235142.1 carbohydrate binding domain-containing protein [Streptococcus suis]HEM3552291.1 carbohydrate binding domain-containing protein [Streptococcus suis]